MLWSNAFPQPWAFNISPLCVKDCSYISWGFANRRVRWFTRRYCRGSHQLGTDSPQTHPGSVAGMSRSLVELFTLGGIGMKVSRLLTWFGAFCVCAACVLSFGKEVSAQSTTDGAIGGTVVDSSGAAVPNAKVTAK